MPKDDKIEVEGKILKSLPGAIFEVELPEEFSNMVIEHMSVVRCRSILSVSFHETRWP
jgi:hypothetical protein